jgi:hypothetical protein
MSTLFLCVTVLVLGVVAIIGGFRFGNGSTLAMDFQRRVNAFLVPLVVAPFLFCQSTLAAPITGFYDVSLSTSVEIRGLMDGNGNQLSSLPSDLSIIGITFNFKDSPYFSSIYGPNRPPDITSSSAGGTTDVIVGGSPAGPGPVALGIGDGFILNSTASGSIGAPISPGSALVSSDISQAGDIRFFNNSLSTTYIVDVLMKLNFNINAQDNSSPTDAFRLDTGYLFDLARRTALTGGTDYTSDYGFDRVVPGQGQPIIGSETFPILFAIAPGEEPILTARTFVGGIGSSPPILPVDAGNIFVPEPYSLTLFVLGVILVTGYCRWHWWLRASASR